VGRNLALPDSFFLQFTNNSSSEQTFNLFNLGGSVQTPITSQQNLSSIVSYDISAFIDISGNLLADTTFEVLDNSFALLSTTSLLTGQNISLVASGLNPIVGTNGKTGTFALTQLLAPNQKLINASVGSANAGNFRIFQTSAPFATQLTTFQQTTASFVTANPLVTLGGTIPYQEIENSETGNAYKVMAMDIYSNKSNQLLQEIQYGMKDANGDKYLIGSTPTIDPYQPSRASIQSVDSQGFTIDSETLFSYNVESFTFVRLTFNYVRAQVSVMKEFDQAFVQQLTMESDKLKRILNLDDASRYILFQ
jgi:hypothetical protein